MNSLTRAPLMILSGVFAVTVIGIVLGPMILALGHTCAASAITTGSVIGAVVYLTALRVLKAVKQEDINLLRKYFGHKLRFATSILR